MPVLKNVKKYQKKTFIGIDLFYIFDIYKYYIHEQHMIYGNGVIFKMNYKP